MIHSSRFRGRSVQLNCLLGYLLITGISASGIGLFVSNNNDAGPGSLREALANNMTNSGGNTIIFSNTLTGTITLIGGELVISTNATIAGPDQAQRFYRGTTVP